MRTALFSTALLLAAAVIGSAADTAEKKPEMVYYDAIVAVVDGKPITGHQLQEEIKASNIVQSLKGGATAENLRQARRQVLDKMIEQEVLIREFEDLKASIPGQMIQERLDQMIFEQADGNMERFEDMLFQNRMTISEIRKKIFRRLAAEMLLYDRVQRDIQVSELEIQDFYQKNSRKFLQKPSYRPQEIHLKKNGRYAGKLPETWQAIRKSLAEGVPFADLAKKYSEDYLAAKGGDMGWQEELNEKLMAVVAKLEKGQLAPEILSAGNSEYLIRLMDRKPGGMRSLDEKLREEIRAEIRAGKEKKRHEEFMAPLLLKYGVRKY